jgi:hypothetical protein
LFSEGGVIFSKLDLWESLTVNEEELFNSSYSFKVRNYYIEPGLKFEHKIYRFISAELTAGYFIQFGKNELETDENEMILEDNHAINSDWTGFRCGLTIVFLIPD